MPVPDIVKEEIKKQLKEWMYFLYVTHLVCFGVGGIMGFFAGKTYARLWPV
jgi:hypothetical protein